MSGRREADDRKPSCGISEAVQRSRPVVLALKAARWIVGTGLAPLDQACAAPTGMDLGCKRRE